MIAAVAIWLVFTTVFGAARVQGNGMRPVAGDGDVAFTYRLVGSLEPDDLVVYRAKDEQLIGRVVAKPGDKVEITSDGDLKVNGSVQPSLTGAATNPGSGAVAYPLTLGPNEYFVLGDGRTQATDSRETGPVGIDEVQGKVIALLRLRDI